VSVLIGKAQQLFEKNLQLDALIACAEALKEMKKQGRENPEQLQKIQSVIFKVQERNQLKAHPGGVYGVNFSPDGTMIASGGVDKKIIIWSPSGKILFSPNERHKDKIWSVRFSPDSKFVASASIDDTIKIWSKKGELIQTLKGHKGDVYDVSFSKNSDRIYSSSQDGNIIIWDIKTGRSLETFQTPNSLNKSEYKIMGLDLEPFKNSVLVYTGNKDYDFSLWDMKNQGKKGIKTIRNTQSLVMSVRFNKKGNMIVSSENKNGNGTIKIWDITGNLIGLIDSPKDGILYAEFSHDSKYIASASSDNTIKIWKVDEVLNKNQGKNNQIGLAQPLTILAGHTEAVNRVSFNPLSSQSIASASDDGTVIIWEISGNKREIKKRYNLDELLTQSCNFLSDYSNMCKNLN
jgi:WD40 repeat protein